MRSPWAAPEPGSLEELLQGDSDFLGCLVAGSSLAAGILLPKLLGFTAGAWAAAAFVVAGFAFMLYYSTGGMAVLCLICAALFAFIGYCIVSPGGGAGSGRRSRSRTPRNRGSRSAGGSGEWHSGGGGSSGGGGASRGF